MKRFTLALFSTLVLSGAALAQPTNTYYNYGTVTTNAVIDALVFYNQGTFTNIETSTYPFRMGDVRYFTNRGVMSGSLGFRFDTVTTTTWKPAISFDNRGTILGVDKDTRYFTLPGTSVLDYGTPASVSSYIEVFSTNIVNSGQLLVGDLGLLQLKGKNVDLTRGALAAGHINNDANTNVFYFDGMSWISDNPTRGLNLPAQYLNPLGVADFYWGIGYWPATDEFNDATNLSDALRIGDNGAFQPLLSDENVTELGRPGLKVHMPLPGSSFDCHAFVLWTNAQNFPWVVVGETNVYVDVSVVLVKTNSLDPNIQIDVLCGKTDQLHPELMSFESDYLATPTANVVRFSVADTDVITGQPTTNAIYFIDRFAGSITNYFLQTNMVAPKAVSPVVAWDSRPYGFEVATAIPREWQLDETNNYEVPYQNDLFSVFGFQNLQGWPIVATYSTYFSGTTRSYAAVVGRNPETLNGLSPYIYTNDVLNNPYFIFPDPTNQPARVEVTADNLNLTQSRIRAEGMLSLNAKHLAGSGPAGVDAGIINGLLGSTNGTLVVSNVLPVEFKRVRGALYAWSADWTRQSSTYYTNGTIWFKTNYNYNYHLLVLDHDLHSTFQPTTRDLTLRATNVVVADNIRAVNKCVFDARNLTLNGKVTMLENARRFDSNNIPSTRNLLVETNGSLLVEDQAFLGWDTKKGLGTVTNRGTISAATCLLKAGQVENSGSIYATNGGAIIVQAGTLNLTSSQPGGALGANQLVSDSGITINADVLNVKSSTIIAGRQMGKLVLNVGTRLTDFTPDVIDPNSSISNYWEVTDGFELSCRPRSGDLLSTTINSMANGYFQVQHTWAGEDRGATVDGYVDNAAVGHLILDRETPESSIHFSAAGTNKNAIYVDRLELSDYAYSDYRNGLVIDDNFTIYYADAGDLSDKLETAYPGRMVWVRDFVGSQSAVSVPLADGGVALMNQALAMSPDIDSDGDGIVNALDPYPLDGVTSAAGTPVVQTLILRPSPTATSPLPTVTTLSIAISGQGSVTPSLSSTNLVIGKTYKLTAMPAPGYVFAEWRGAVQSHSAKISFTFKTNSLLQAIFIPNPFTPRKGVYSGLFNDADVNVASSGGFTLTLADGGVFSGKLLVGGKAYPFRSSFSLVGWTNSYSSTLAVSGPGGARLTLTFFLDATDPGLDQIWGSVSSKNWLSSLWGNRAVYNAITNSAPESWAGNGIGKFTFVLPGVAPVGGDGYGMATVLPNGTVTAKGKLADGTVFSQSGTVAKDGSWPFYVPLYGGKGFLLSWINFDLDMGGLGSTNFTWIKPKTASGFYRGGFTNQFECIGSAYTPMTSGFGLSFSSGSLVFSGGNLDSKETYDVFSNPLNYSFADQDQNVYIQLDRLAGGSGYFTGKFVYTKAGRAAVKTMEGVILQKQDTARGFFLGTDQSGSVLLTNPNQGN